MNLDLTWRFARLHQLLRRAWGSLALRGWKGTLRRITEQLQRQDSEELTGDIPVPIGRKRILVVDAMTPDPSRDSGSLRLCMMLHLLHQNGWHVDLLPDDRRANADDAAMLLTYGIHLHRDNVMAWLRAHGQSLDAILLCRLSVAAQYLTIARRLAPQAKCIFDTVDLHFLREQRAAETSGSYRMRRQSIASRRQELALIRASDISFVVSPVELALLKQELPESHIELLSNIHEVHGRAADFKARRDLLFVGGFGHPPNEDAMRWFVGDILPLLRQKEPDLRVHIAGDISAEARHTLAQPGVVIHGRVDDLSALMHECKISVAPLRFGAGVKGKVNMAMSYGLPVVVTSIAAEGMHLMDGKNALIADSAIAFANAVLRLYRDEALWMHLSDEGMTNVRNHFSPEEAKRTLCKVLPANIATDIHATLSSSPDSP